ncbi:MAG: hypothetical protein V1858_01565 [Candidatus Gottesmanbacteria bacterium]
MEFKANFAQIVGTPKEGYDSWVYAENGLFLVMAISANADFPLASFGQEMLTKLSQEYHNLSQKNLANIEQILAKLEIQNADLSLVLAAQVNNACYVFCRGGGRVILKRQDKFAIILEEKESASGLLENQDVILLTSPKFNDLVTFDEIIKASNPVDNQPAKLTVSEIAESLTSLLHRAEDTSGAACLIIEFHTLDNNVPEEVIANVPETIPQEETPMPSSRIKSIISSIRSKIHWPISKLPILYLRSPQDEEQKKKRLMIGIIGILVVLLAVSIIMGINKKITSSKQNQFNQIYQASVKQYEEGKALVGLNNQHASTLLSTAKNSLTDLQKKSGGNDAQFKKIDDLLVQIEQALGATNQIYQLVPEVFMGIDLIKENGQGIKMAIMGENIIILDAKNNTIYQVNIKSKEAKMISAGEDLAGLKSLTVTDLAIYAFADKGILKCQVSNNKCSVVIETDKDWGDIVDIKAFGTNIYLLDRAGNKIWKYSGTGNGFGQKVNYLDQELSLSGATSMTIDGVVWIATDKIIKLVQGSQENFNIAGLNQPLGNNSIIFTTEESKNLYILDKQSFPSDKNNHRVVISDKSGAYKSQYVWSKIGDISDMIISEEAKKLFLLSGSKIYFIDVK